jgi:hypothetical protein
MAPLHRLAIELSDQRNAALPQQTSPLKLKRRSLYHSITAKRFSRVPGTFDSLGMKVP